MYVNGDCLVSGMKANEMRRSHLNYSRQISSFRHLENRVIICHGLGSILLREENR